MEETNITEAEIINEVKVEPTVDIYKETSADDLLKELSQDKQKFETSTEFKEESLPAAEPSEAEKKAIEEKKKNTIELNQLASSVIVDSADRLIGWSCSLIALDDAIDEYCADKESKENMKQLVRAMLPKDMVAMPPWLQLIIMLPLIYGPAYKNAFKNRKENKELKEHKNELKRLQRQKEIKDIKEEKQNIKQELEKIEIAEPGT